MKKIIIGFGILVLITAILILRPVPTITEDNAIVKSGIVVDIYDGGGNDIVFNLKDDERVYYINRGLQLGLELNTLRESLIGNEIVIKYPKYWTPLDWNNQINHISIVEFDNEIVFNELP